MEADIMQSEINALKELVDNEGREKAELLATHLSLNFNLREKQALQKQNEEIIRIQSASIKDLELGAATFENRLLQLEKTLLLSNDKKQVKTPRPIPESMKPMVEQLFPAEVLQQPTVTTVESVNRNNIKNAEPVPTITQQGPPKQPPPTQSIGKEDTQKQQAVKGVLTALLHFCHSPLFYSQFYFLFNER